MPETKKSTSPFTLIKAKAFIESHNPKKAPNPPLELVQFRQLNKYEKLKKVDFYKQAQIQVYLKDKWKAEEYNYSSFKSLYELTDVVKYNHPEEMGTLGAKLLEFKIAIIHTDHIFPAMMIDFNMYNVPDVEVPDESEEISWEE